MNNVKNSYKTMTFGSLLARLITSAIILGITAFFTPGFQIASLWTLILAAVVLTIIDYLANTVFSFNLGTFGTGIVGFIVAGIVLYSVQFFVSGYSISWISAIVGAIVYGIVAAIIPGR